MILALGETATVLTRTVTGTDRYGKQTFGWTTATDVPDCLFDPGTSDENPSAFRTVTNTRPTLYAPAGTTVTAVDKVVVRGVTYDLDGEPGDWRLGAWRPGLEIKLARQEG